MPISLKFSGSCQPRPQPPSVTTYTAIMDAYAKTYQDKPNAKPRFLVRDFDRVEYEINPDCWTRYMNLSCCAVGTSQGLNKTATLITPSCGIMAAHYKLNVGDWVHFMDQRGIVHERKIVDRTVHYLYKGKESGYYPDLCIVKFDKPVEGCTPANILPSDWKDYLPSDGNGLPALSLDKQDHCTMREVRSVASPGSATFRQPLDEVRATLYEDLIGGDSSDPGFLIGYPVPTILTCWTFGGWGAGTSITYIASVLGKSNWIDKTCNALAGETPTRQTLYK